MNPLFARVLMSASLFVFATGCAHLSAAKPSAVPLAPQVELDRYAGDWYLIAHIPTSRDVGAHNATEHYALRPDGGIGITYRNRLGGFDGKHKLMTPVAKVIDNSGNALWGVRFGWYWPFWYEYRIAHVEADYSVAIVARSKRDFIWLFSRQPQMSDAALARYSALIASWGYESGRIERVPQQWPNPVDGATPVLGPYKPGGEGRGTDAP
ncbi:MAG: lipocalin family protein [Panacagrimonas sp.]